MKKKLLLPLKKSISQANGTIGKKIIGKKFPTSTVTTGRQQPLRSSSTEADDEFKTKAKDVHPETEMNSNSGGVQISTVTDSSVCSVM